MKFSFLLFILFSAFNATSEVPVDLSAFNKKNGDVVSVKDNLIDITWPVGKLEKGRRLFNMKKDEPLFSKVSMTKGELLETLLPTSIFHSSLLLVKEL